MFALCSIATWADKTVYIPNSWVYDSSTQEYTEGGNSDLQWSYNRSKQTANCILFWQKGFGSDPASITDTDLQFDPDVVLAVAETCYALNVNALGFSCSNMLNKYKIIILMNYTKDWICYGGGYDFECSALWLNPSTVHPAGHSLAHEVGHSFHYMCYAEAANYNHESSSTINTGFHLSCGKGQAIWEQTAQWQAAQAYPELMFDQSYPLFGNNANYAFSHEFMRYQSYWFLYYLCQHYNDIQTVAKVWKQPMTGQTNGDATDFCQALMALKSLTAAQFYELYFDYALHCATYDFDVAASYRDNYIGKFDYRAVQLENGKYQVAYASAPQSTGFNVIELSVPTSGTTLTTAFTALTPGCPLAAGDKGDYNNGASLANAGVSSYNSMTSAQAAYRGFRVGYVFLKSDGTRTYYNDNTVHCTGTGKKTESISTTVPANTSRIFLVVAPALTNYVKHKWDENILNDDQWPYQFQVTGATPKSVTPYFNEPDFKKAIDGRSIADVTLTFNVVLPPTSGYDGTTVSFSGSGLNAMCTAFQMEGDDIWNSAVAYAATQDNGTIMNYAVNANGSLQSSGNTANGDFGHWFNESGTVTNWGNNSVAFVEFSKANKTASVGQMPGANSNGTTRTIREALVYKNSSGNTAKAIFVFNITFDANVSTAYSYLSAIDYTNPGDGQGGEESKLYPGHFNLEEVTLADSPLKTAMDRNIQLLLQYDIDRLLTPYIRQAGLSTGIYAGWEGSHPSFSNWGSSDFNLDGHVGGHYLTALSLAYAACHDATTKAQLKTRLDKMVSVMKDCQDAYESNTEGLKGFIGGQPMNDAWKRLYVSQDIGLAGTGSCAVPWYVQHKILAGLRDAYIYGGNETARTVFLKLCDWCILVTSTLNDQQMEDMLNTEHGGINETLLDAYKLTNDSKYLTAAKRFTHKTMLNGMQSLNTTFLDNKHANTQVPKYIGMERIFEEDASATAYRSAAENFWTDVAQNRTVCIGGNSMYEHFLAAGNSAQYINHLDGPESCNTNNMLKLSEMMADRTHDARYADFYEYATWNHILSTQDPTTGGYVYFTTLRPQGYRIYSTVNESMWCCVGTGMENHSKYGHFIYTHDGASTLYVNLFTPSTLDNEIFKLTQATSYPFSDESTLTVGKAGTYTIAIRHPWWTTAGYKVYINNAEQNISVTAGTASYVSLNRTWSVGDVIRVVVPMELRYTPCPNYTDYIAFQYGPILLAAQTSTGNAEEAASKHLLYEASLQNEYGHEGRMDHAPGSMGKKLSLTSAPLLIGSRDGENGVLSKISSIDRSSLTFTLDASRDGVSTYTWQSLTLLPFYQIHHARYSCYWYQQTAENYANSSMAAEEAAAEAIESRTLDFVATGEQQSEAGHFTSYNNSTTGVYNDEYYRDARPSDGYLQYTLAYTGEAIESGLSILCRFTQADAGRKATLYVDGTPIANITALAAFNGTVTNGFYNVEFPIPARLMRDAQNNVKQSFVVRLAADKGTNAPGLYYVRLMKEYDPNLPATVTTTAGDVRSVIDGVVTGENGQSEMAHGFDFTGDNDGWYHGTYQNKYWRDAPDGKYYSYDLSTNGQTEGVSLVVEYWCGDGDRLCDITIDGVRISTQGINALRSAFLVFEYPIDPALLKGKEKVCVRFDGVGGKMTPGSYNVYITKGRTTTARTKTPYTFVPENFEKNGNDGNISSMTYNDGAIQITSGGGDYQMNMRMKTSVKDTYSILPSQYLMLVKGQSLSTNAYLWWLFGCNHGAQDAPTYTLVSGGDTYLVWDLRKVATFNDSEKNARFFGVSETLVTTANGSAFSLLCMGLTSSASGNATISDIGFYSPDELVDKYAVLKKTLPSMATTLTTGDTFVFGDYVYTISSTTEASATHRLSSADSYLSLPESVFGYTIANSTLTLDETEDFKAARDITAAHVTVNKTMTANAWNTLVIPFDMSIPSGWVVKEPTAFDGSMLTFSDASAIEAGKPYIVKPTSAVTSFSADNVTVEKDLHNTTVSDLTMTGTYSKIAAIDYSTQDCYVIGIREGASALYLVNSAVSLKPFRAYFAIPSGSVKANVISLSFDEETSITEITNHKSVNDIYYDLSGRRVELPRPGLYIVNGKKVIVK